MNSRIELLLQLAFRPRQQAKSPQTAAWRTGLASVGALCVGCLVFANLTSLAAKASRGVDEWGYVVSAVHYTELVVKGDFTSPEWEGAELGGFGSLNPHAGQWWFGLWLLLNPETKNLHFGPEKERQLLSEGAWQSLPDDSVPKAAVQTARLANAAAGALCIVMIYLMVYRVAGIAPGVLAATLASTLPPFQDVLCRAFADGIYNLGLLIATWALVEITVLSRRFSLWLSLCAGIALGLAFNAKITALAVGIPLVIAIAFCAAWLARVTTPFTATLRRFALAPIVAVAVAWAANPYFWPTATPPPGGGRIAAILPAALGGDFPWPTTTEGHGPIAFRLLEIQIRWQRHLTLAADYFSSQKASALLVLRRIFLTYNHHRPGFALDVLAFAFVTLAHYRKWRLPVPLIAFQLSAFIHILFLVLVQPLDWNRYYLPAILHLQIAVAATLGYAVAVITSSATDVRSLSVQTS